MNNSSLENELAKYARAYLSSGHENHAPRLIKPSAGVKSFVRFAEFSNGPSYVLRAYPSYRNDRLRKRLAADELIRRHDLPAPKVIQHRKGFPLLRSGIIVEEHLSGTHPLKWNGTLAETLADCLASFHRVHSSWFGSIVRPNRKSFAQFWMQRLKNRLREIRVCLPNAPVLDMLRDAERWLETFVPILDSMRQFELIHDQLNPGNILQVEPDCHLVLLDFETLQYGSRVKDLAQVRQNLFLDEAIWQTFFSRYCRQCTAEEIAGIQALMPFFRAYNHVSTMAASCKRKARKDAPVRITRKFERRASALAELMDEKSG